MPPAFSATASTATTNHSSEEGEEMGVLSVNSNRSAQDLVTEHVAPVDTSIKGVPFFMGFVNQEAEDLFCQFMFRGSYINSLIVLLVPCEFFFMFIFYPELSASLKALLLVFAFICAMIGAVMFAVSCFTKWFTVQQIAKVEEGCITAAFLFTTVVMGAMAYPKQTACIEQFTIYETNVTAAGALANLKTIEVCTGYVDYYVLAALEAFCVIAPARGKFVVPICLLTMLTLGVSVTWAQNVSGADHGMRMVVELFLLAVNITACLIREHSYRTLFCKVLEGKKVTEATTFIGAVSAQLLTRILPSESILSLKENSVMFVASNDAVVFRSDIANFTKWSNSEKPFYVVQFLSALTEAFDRLALQYNLSKVKTIGDAYWAVAGLLQSAGEAQQGIKKKYSKASLKDTTKAAQGSIDMCNFALDSMAFVEKLFNGNLDASLVSAATPGLADTLHLKGTPEGLRMGIAKGRCVATTVGTQQVSIEVLGPADKNAQYLEAKAPVYGILTTENVAQDCITEQNFNFIVMEKQMTLPCPIKSDDDNKKEPIFILCSLDDMRHQSFSMSPSGSTIHHPLGPDEEYSPPQVIAAASTPSRANSRANSRFNSSTNTPKPEAESIADNWDEVRSLEGSEASPVAARSLKERKIAVHNSASSLSRNGTQSINLEMLKSSKSGLITSLLGNATGDKKSDVEKQLEETDSYDERLNEGTLKWTLYPRFTEELEGKFVEFGLKTERLPSQVLGFTLSAMIATLTIALFATVSDVNKALPNLIALVCLFFVSLIFPIWSIVAPPKNRGLVSIGLLLYYGMGAGGILAAGLMEPTHYLTRSVFYLRMAFAVLKGSIVTIPNTPGIIYDCIFPSLAVGIVLMFKNTEDDASRSHLIEEVIWLFATVFVGYLCRIVSESRNRRNFLGQRRNELITTRFIDLHAQANTIMNKAVPARFTEEINAWYLEKARKSTSLAGEAAAIIPNTSAPSQIVHHFPTAAVAFISANSTATLAKDSDAEQFLSYASIQNLTEFFKHTENLLGAFSESLIKVKTVGDTLIVASIPSTEGVKDSPIVVAPLFLYAMVLDLCSGKSKNSPAKHPVKVGLHVGELVGCVIGEERLTYDLLGDTMNTASRFMSSTKVAAGSSMTSMSKHTLDILRREVSLMTEDSSISVPACSKLTDNAKLVGVLSRYKRISGHELLQKINETSEMRTMKGLGEVEAFTAAF